MLSMSATMPGCSQRPLSTLHTRNVIMRVTSSEVHISMVYINQATLDVAPDPLSHHTLAGHHEYHLQERCLSFPHLLYDSRDE